MADPLQPSPALLCKLGSAIVHAQELYSSNGHAFDKAALDTVLGDPEVVEWMRQMDKQALLPKVRQT
jgi:hypothetical protein